MARRGAAKGAVTASGPSAGRSPSPRRSTAASRSWCPTVNARAPGPCWWTAPRSPRRPGRPLLPLVRVPAQARPRHRSCRAARPAPPGGPPRRRSLHPRPVHRREPPPLDPAGRGDRRAARPAGAPGAPLDPQARIRVRSADARAGLGRIQDGWADLVIADVFSGARTPAHLTSAEFLAEVRRVLKPGGQYAANLADGPRSPICADRSPLPPPLPRTGPGRRSDRLARPPLRKRGPGRVRPADRGRRTDQAGRERPASRPCRTGPCARRLHGRRRGGHRRGRQTVARPAAGRLRLSGPFRGREPPRPSRW